MTPHVERVDAPPAGADRGASAWIVGAATLAAGAVLAVEAAVVAGSTAAVLFTLQIVCAAVFTTVAVLRIRTEPGRGWVGLTVLGGAWLANRILAALSGADAFVVTDDGVAALVLLVGLPFGLVGIYRQCLGGIPGPTRRRMLADASVSAVALALVGWVLYEHLTLGGDRPPPDRWLLFPAVLLMAASLLVTAGVVQPGSRRPWWLAAACLAELVAVAGILHQVGTGRPVGGELVVVARALTPVLTLGYVLSPPVAPVDQDTARRAARGPRRLLLYVPAILAIGAGIAEVVLHGGMYGPAVVLGMLLAAVVMVNHRLVLAEEGSALRRAELSEARFRAIFDQAPLGLAVADGTSQVIEANAALARMLHRPLAEVVGARADEIFTPEGSERREERRRRFRAGEIDRFTHEEQVRRPGRPPGWARVTVSRIHDDAEIRAMAVVEDVTDRHLYEEQLRYLADHDELTGLGNRHRLEHDLAETVTAAAAEQLPGAVLVVDLDQFKLVNDSLGHAAGDRLLVVCGERIAVAVGDAGAVARFGGDEFCVVLHPATAADHRRAAERITAAVQGVVDLTGGDTYPTASTGAVLTRSGIDPEQLLSEADAALYRAKDRGRNRVEWHGPSEVARARRDQRTLGELHRALDRGDLVVFHQPVLDLDTGRTVGSEALVRWPHPDRGLLLPGEFIPLAERSGLMRDVGRQVLTQACSTAAAWPDRGGPLAVAVNLAPHELLDPGFVEQVASVLADTGLSADRLWLEITESALMQDVGTCDRVLVDLRELGVHLSLDDFGTGFSSLTYLKRFPVEAIKIDRSFVAGLGTDRGDEKIVAALVGLGREMGLKVVAEGVETTMQLDRLRALGCPLGQGFLFGPAVPAEDFLAALGSPTALAGPAVSAGDG